MHKWEDLPTHRGDDVGTERGEELEIIQRTIDVNILSYRILRKTSWS